MDAMGLKGLDPVGGGVSKKRLIRIFRHVTKSCHWMYIDGLKSYKRSGTQYMVPTKPIFSGRFNQKMGHNRPKFTKLAIFQVIRGDHILPPTGLKGHFSDYFGLMASFYDMPLEVCV